MKLDAPLLVPVIGIIAGIVAAGAGFPLWSSSAAILAGCAIYYTITLLYRNPVRAYGLSKFHPVWIFLLFFGAAIFSYRVNAPTCAALTDNDKIIGVIGQVRNITQPTVGDKAEIDLSRVIYENGKVKDVEDMPVILRSDALDVVVDDVVFIPAGPDIITDSPEYFDSGYAERMRSKGIFYAIHCQGSDIRPLSHRTTLKGISFGLRDQLEAGMEKSGLKRETRNFLITILLGDRSYLDEDLRSSFADAGISHILALSGMHIAIISMIILWLLFPMNIAGKYKMRLVLTCLLLLIYTFVTGMQASTMRSALMISAVTVCNCFERKNSAWNSLLFAVGIILIANPMSLYDPGLQLSFISVASLIFFANPLNPFGHHENPRLYRLYALILASLTATFGTWCISAYYFHQIPLMFLPANLLILPVLPYFVIAALLYFLLHTAGIEMNLLGRLIDRVFESMTWFVDFLTNHSTSAVHVQPSAISVFIWIALTIITAILLNGKKNKLHITLASVLCLLFAGSIAADIVQNRNEDGFIIRRNIDKVTILTRIENHEEILYLKPNVASQCELIGKKIVSIDCNLKNYEALPHACDILILSAGNKSDLEELIEHIKPRLIAIHPSVRKKREQKLLATADSLGIPKHSIRLDGPLKVMK